MRPDVPANKERKVTVSPSILALALFVGQSSVSQASDAHEFLGKVETINKSTWCIGVRSSASEGRRVFYVEKRTQITKDGTESANFADLCVSDVVSLTWKLRRDPVLEDKRMVQTLDVRPTVWPDKFKVGQTGYLPPQSDRYQYVVEAVIDDQTVLIREIFVITQQTPGRTSPRPSGGVKRPGEEFFLSSVRANDYPVGRKVQLDGKWRVKTAKSADVTFAGAIQTRKFTNSQTGQSERQAELNTQGQGDEDVTVNGSTTERSLKGKGNTDQNLKEKTASKGAITSTEQRDETRKISAFLLVPLEKERE